MSNRVKRVVLYVRDWLNIVSRKIKKDNIKVLYVSTVSTVSTVSSQRLVEYCVKKDKEG